MSSAIVLLSSGLDSTVNLYKAVQELKSIRALFFDYSQRANKKEWEMASKTCSHLGVDLKKIDIRWMVDFSNSSLTNELQQVPVDNQVSIDSRELSLESAKSVWVPNRNGLFLNIAAAWAESLEFDFIIPGFNWEEAQTFPDNTQDFLNAADRSFYFSTQNHVRTLCYTTDKNKTEIVRMGRELGVYFEWVWPCYFGNDKICGRCESCQRYQRALTQADKEKP